MEERFGTIETDFDEGDNDRSVDCVSNMEAAAVYCGWLVDENGTSYWADKNLEVLNQNSFQARLQHSANNQNYLACHLWQTSRLPYSSNHHGLVVDESQSD